MKASMIILFTSLFVAVSAGPSINLSVKTSSAETNPSSTEADGTPYQDEMYSTPSTDQICIDYDCVCGQIEELTNELLDVPTDETNVIDEDYLGELNDNPVCVQRSEDEEYDNASYSYCFSPGDIDRIQSENLEMGNQAVYDKLC